MSAIRPVLVVAGVGNGSGTGAATARLFSKAGYRVALIARNADELKKTAEAINQSGGEAAAFPVPSYGYKDVTNVFSTIKSHNWPSPQKAEVRVALWNAAHGVWKNFLDVTQEDIEASVQDNIVGAFAFSHEVIFLFKDNEIDELGRRGTLLFTGATASIRGNVVTSAFAAGKHGVRALSQSLAKEFGKQNIHLATAIIDGGILTDRSLSRRTGDAKTEFEKNEDIRLSADSIAQSYLYLTNQDRSAWSWEIDLRPAHEKW
ncbi:NAD(P)-binding protein [Panus rudis PR-1116 ss-1]|nr:NAD(P)-binding protein [Panus rudis PR-1116 ss-1]